MNHKDRVTYQGNGNINNGNNDNGNIKKGISNNGNSNDENTFAKYNYQERNDNNINNINLQNEMNRPIGNFTNNNNLYGNSRVELGDNLTKSKSKSENNSESIHDGSRIETEGYKYAAVSRQSI
jgi:hypothetical protein